MPRCGGCGGVCGCSLTPTASIGVGGNGQPTTPWSPSVRRSLALGNTMVELADGLFVGTQTPAPVVIADTNTVNLSGDGTGGNPISAVLQPAPYAHMTGTGTIASTTNQDVTLGTTVELTGLTYSAPNVVVGAGNGGIYVIEAHAAFAFAAGGSPGTIRGFAILCGGSTSAAVSDARPPFTAGTFPTSLNLSLVIRLAAGDTVKINCEQNSGAPLNVTRWLRMTRTGI